jgi:hypothetical protein
MKSNRTILAIALDIAACAGVLLTSATPSIRAQEEKAAASPSATKDDSGKQAGTSGKVAAAPSYNKAPVAVARAQERPKEESKKEATKKAKKTKKSNKSKRDEAGTEAGTSGKK